VPEALQGEGVQFCVAGVVKGEAVIGLSLGMGTAPYTPGTSMSLDELVARADIIMYEDKRAEQGRT